MAENNMGAGARGDLTARNITRFSFLPVSSVRINDYCLFMTGVKFASCNDKVLDKTVQIGSNYGVPTETTETSSHNAGHDETTTIHHEGFRKIFAACHPMFAERPSGRGKALNRNCWAACHKDPPMQRIQTNCLMVAASRQWRLSKKSD